MFQPLDMDEIGYYLYMEEQEKKAEEEVIVVQNDNHSLSESLPH